MKDQMQLFDHQSYRPRPYQHYIVQRSPWTSDEEVEELLEILRANPISPPRGIRVLIIEPPLEFWWDEPSSRASWRDSWRALGIRVAMTSRGPR